MLMLKELVIANSVVRYRHIILISKILQIVFKLNLSMFKSDPSIMIVKADSTSNSFEQKKVSLAS